MSSSSWIWVRTSPIVMASLVLYKKSVGESNIILDTAGSRRALCGLVLDALGAETVRDESTVTRW
jgi:hypothetical protein